MTWVVGVNAFNGVLGVADVQVTFPFADPKRPPIYRDCLKKIHRIWTNLYVAFSGDVKVGLNVIHCFRDVIYGNFDPETLFSLEGQLSEVQHVLRELFRKHAEGRSVDLELMFVFVHQEGDSTLYQPGLCRFIAPDFRINSSGPLQIDQCGSGKRSAELQAVAGFLRGTGDMADPVYRSLFDKAPESPTLFTVKKARTLLTKEAAVTLHPGVGTAYCSVMAETGWDRLFNDQDNERVRLLMRELGILEYEQRSRSDSIRTWRWDLKDFRRRLARLSAADPAKYLRLASEFRGLHRRMDRSSLYELPVFEEYFHCGGTALTSANELCTTWDEVVQLMQRQGYNVRACNAVA